MENTCFLKAADGTVDVTLSLASKSTGRKLKALKAGETLEIMFVDHQELEAFRELLVHCVNCNECTDNNILCLRRQLDLSCHAMVCFTYIAFELDDARLYHCIRTIITCAIENNEELLTYIFSSSCSAAAIEGILVSDDESDASSQNQSIIAVGELDDLSLSVVLDAAEEFEPVKLDPHDATICIICSNPAGRSAVQCRCCHRRMCLEHVESAEKSRFFWFKMAFYAAVNGAEGLCPECAQRDNLESRLNLQLRTCQLSPRHLNLLLDSPRVAPVWKGAAQTCIDDLRKAGMCTAGVPLPEFMRLYLREHGKQLCLGHSRWFVLFLGNVDWDREDDRRLARELVRAFREISNAHHDSCNGDGDGNDHGHKILPCEVLCCPPRCRKSLTVEDAIELMQFLPRPTDHMLREVWQLVYDSLGKVDNSVVGDHLQVIWNNLPAFVFKLRSDPEETAPLLPILLDHANHNVQFASELFFLIRVAMELSGGQSPHMQAVNLQHVRDELLTSCSPTMRDILRQQERTAVGLLDSCSLRGNIGPDFFASLKRSLNSVCVPTMVEVDRPILCPERCRVMDSNERPLRLCFGERSVLLKFECGLQDYIVQHIVRLCEKLLLNDGLVRHILTYQIIPFSVNGVIMEWVDGSISLSRFTDSQQLIDQIFNSTTDDNDVDDENDDDTDARQDHHNRNLYLRSLAAYTVMMMMLGIGDRHLDNMQLRDKVFYNLDYGFILGDEPGFKPHVHAFRARFVQGLPTKYIKKFIRLATSTFKCLRKHAALFEVALWPLLELPTPYRPQKWNREHIHTVIHTNLHLDKSESDASEHFAQHLTQLCKADTSGAEFVDIFRAWYKKPQQA
eukprot:m.76215 g.76215  ORF g.76215 m.76215 type:complete len:849 (+) comp8106_c0_seq5:225-2771(+)